MKFISEHISELGAYIEFAEVNADGSVSIFVLLACTGFEIKLRHIQGLGWMVVSRWSYDHASDLVAVRAMRLVRGYYPTGLPRGVK